MDSPNKHRPPFQITDQCLAIYSKKKSNEQLYVQPRILVQFLKRHISLSDLWMQIGLCAKCLGMDLTRRLFVHTVISKPFVLFRYFAVC